MKYAVSIRAIAIIVILLLTVNTSFAMGSNPKTKTMIDKNMSGVYTIIHYVSTSFMEPKVIAILDLEGDDYTFVIDAPEHEYTVTGGVPAEQAREQAIQFIGSLRYRMKKVLDDKGQIIGYDVRRLHHILRYGSSDILAVNYQIKDKKVIVRVDLKSSFKKYYYRDMYGGD